MQNWLAGEGWPEWSAGMAALYASELAANHLFDDFEASNKLDEHGDGGQLACWLA